MTQCAVRECREEVGLDIGITRLVRVFSDPRHVIAFAERSRPDNGWPPRPSRLTRHTPGHRSVFGCPGSENLNG